MQVTFPSKKNIPIPTFHYCILKAPGPLLSTVSLVAYPLSTLCKGESSSLHTVLVCEHFPQIDAFFFFVNIYVSG